MPPPTHAEAPGWAGPPACRYPLLVIDDTGGLHPSSPRPPTSSSRSSLGTTRAGVIAMSKQAIRAVRRGLRRHRRRTSTGHLVRHPDVITINGDRDPGRTTRPPSQANNTKPTRGWQHPTAIRRPTPVARSRSGGLPRRKPLGSGWLSLTWKSRPSLHIEGCPSTPATRPIPS